MTPLGRIVRLQVQTGSLKLGEKPHRVYDPAPLAPVEALRLTPRGAEGVTAEGKTLVDVHHAAHPRTKYAQYGERIVTGCAGENILLESERIYRLEDFAFGLAFRSAASGATVHLDAVTVADPCVEFSRFSLGDPAAAPQDLKPVLQFLGEGTRGYCFTPAGEMRLIPGDLLVAL
jgi:hypothetical protein